MSTVSQSVSSLKTHLATLNTYVGTIDGEYHDYVNSHNAHTCAQDQVQYVDGFRPTSGHSWLEYKNEVSEVATWVEKYVDDSAWVDALDRRCQKWGTAFGHTSDAYDDVDSKNFPAVDSWKGPAGGAYREVVPTMQAGTSSAHFGASLMKTASSWISEAGETFFTDVAAAVSTLAGSLTHLHPGRPAPRPRRPAFGGSHGRLQLRPVPRHRRCRESSVDGADRLRRRSVGAGVGGHRSAADRWSRWPRVRWLRLGPGPFHGYLAPGAWRQVTDGTTRHTAWKVLPRREIG